MAEFNFLRDSQRRNRVSFETDAAGYQVAVDGLCNWPTKRKRRCQRPEGECAWHSRQGPAPKAEEML